jgi:endonuclease/exonuclease/phosphatase family metal-dependent hydrolase
VTIEHDPGYGPLVETRVRIATWNLWGRYGPWEARYPAIRETLRRVDADIVGLQEVWEDDERNQACELARELGYDSVVFAHNLERDGARSGNAILARWPFRRTEVRALPREGGGVRDDEGEERLVVFAEVEGPRGPVQLFCAHLSWRSDHSAIRQEQVRKIATFIREMRPRSFPAVLVGDLNAEPTSDELRMLTGLAPVPVPGVVLRDAWDAVDPGARGDTVTNDNPFSAANLDVARRIDYVLLGQPKLGGVGHALHVELTGNEPVDGMWPSDHYGVVAELRY